MQGQSFTPAADTTIAHLHIIIATAAGSGAYICTFLHTMIEPKGRIVKAVLLELPARFCCTTS